MMSKGKFCVSRQNTRKEQQRLPTVVKTIKKDPKPAAAAASAETSEEEKA